MVLKIDMTGFPIQTIFEGLLEKLDEGFSMFLVGTVPPEYRRTEFQPERFDGAYVIPSGSRVATPIENCTHIYIHDFLMDKFGSNKPINEYAVKIPYKKFADLLADNFDSFEFLFNAIRKENYLVPANYNNTNRIACQAEMTKEARNAVIDDYEDLLGDEKANNTLDNVIKEAGEKVHKQSTIRRMPRYYLITIGNASTAESRINSIIEMETKVGRKIKFMQGSDTTLHMYFE